MKIEKTKRECKCRWCKQKIKKNRLRVKYDNPFFPFFHLNCFEPFIKNILEGRKEEFEQFKKMIKQEDLENELIERGVDKL